MAQQIPGMKCPVCGTFIPTSIQELLNAKGLVCPNCGLELSINRNESRRAMEILQDVDNAQKNLDKASKVKY